MPISSFGGYGIMNRLAVVAAHPDDEMLSAGALLVKAHRLGFKITIIWATSGEGSASATADKRHDEAKGVAEALEALPMFMELSDTDMTLPETIKRLDSIIGEVKPKYVVWPFGIGDEQHQDHRVLHSAMINVSRRPTHRFINFVASQPPVFYDNAFRPTDFLGYGNAIMEEKIRLLNYFKSEVGKRFFREDVIRRNSEHWADQSGLDSLHVEPFMSIKGSLPRDFFSNEINLSTDVEEFLNRLKLDDGDYIKEAYIWLNRLKAEGMTLDPHPRVMLDAEIMIGNAGGIIFCYCHDKNSKEYFVLNAFQEHISEQNRKIELSKAKEILYRYKREDS